MVHVAFSSFYTSDISLLNSSKYITYIFSNASTASFIQAMAAKRHISKTALQGENNITPNISEKSKARQRRGLASSETNGTKNRCIPSSRSPKKMPNPKKTTKERCQHRASISKSRPSKPKTSSDRKNTSLYSSPLPKSLARFGLRKDPARMKSICRWMLQHSTLSVRGHEYEFGKLLAALGFSDSSFSDQLKKDLRAEVQGKIRENAEDFKTLGAFTLVHRGSERNKVVQFAEWTECWMSDNWDGDPRPPSCVTLFFNPYFGEAQKSRSIRPLLAKDCGSTSLLSPEALVFEELEITHQPRKSSKGDKQDTPLITPDQSSKVKISALSSLNFRQMSSLANSTKNYEVDVSELPQYQSVQLTQSDPLNPLRLDVHSLPPNFDWRP